MYRRPKFIETLHKVRQEMAAEADHDVILFAEKVRSGEFTKPAREIAAGEEREAAAKKDRPILRKR
ncbi:MAG: hypothetical protein UZ17_ACD001002491 [Acidobacteria bacterium OLB17]|nr:MAG: hypothetical protein UZ17_ACD001002491 [Acidobacteria bacterium OLB17]MCZ2390967.1 hypothetical protein [Acidobacteriota bacterium]